jgi:4-hydroxybenzoate polyprenyltransferase
MFPWIEIMRLSNAPTVASNVLAGIAVGMLFRLSGLATPWDTALMLIAGTLLVYVAGMVLNDVCDADADSSERPGRPIPSGRISRGSALLVGVVLLLAGTTLLTLVGQGILTYAVALGVSVLLYDTLHRMLPLSWLLLALCRALIVVIAARAISPGTEWPLLAWVAGSLFAYVAALSIAARDEVRGLRQVSRGAARIVPLLTLLPAGVFFFDIPREHTTAGVIAMGVLLLVAMPSALIATRQAVRGRGGVPYAVGGWIGTIPLMDAAVCFMLGRPWLGLTCVGLWGVSGAMRTRIHAS